MQLKYSVLFLLSLLCILFSCQSDPERAAENYLSLQGETMGTYYKVTYEDARQRNLKESIDSLLIALNNEVSTYIPTSVISTFNSAEDSLVLAEKGRRSDHFITNLMAAAEMYALSDGAFDPTVMPLINYWGFGYSKRQPVTKVDSSKIKTLKMLVGFDQLDLVEEGERVVLKKPVPEIQLDFSALAKGYGVDIVGQLLAKEGIENYLVDIGGEVIGKGLNAKGEPWSIGVSRPSETSKLTDLVAVIPLDNKAMATSGNYRNFYEVNGIKYSHTINPKTGFPERNTLLSATIVADNCMEADALATACMVKGTKAAIKWIQELQGVEAYLIYGKEDGSMGSWYSEGLKEVFE
jgi:thiamine biosynthesis lipoprotein